MSPQAGSGAAGHARETESSRAWGLKPARQLSNMSGGFQDQVREFQAGPGTPGWGPGRSKLKERFTIVNAEYVDQFFYCYNGEFVGARSHIVQQCVSVFCFKLHSKFRTHWAWATRTYPQHFGSMEGFWQRRGPWLKAQCPLIPRIKASRQVSTREK